MFLLFVGVVALAIWILRLVSRVNLLEIRLAKAETSLERALAQPQDVPVVPVMMNVTPPPVVAAMDVVPQPVVPAVVQPPAARPAVAETLVAPADSDTSAAWELIVGGNWLNKIGVLIFVIGLALLVGYSMTRVGPAGRVGIGFAVSLGLLGAGTLMEQRDDYRTYGRGLIAGGWAGTYFTTYAMHAVDAARVLDSDVIAIALLIVVAAVMVLQSLRYRSQTVTTLAYVVAYATLALTPLRGFALVASVPLTVSLLVVAQRFLWPGVQVVGLVSTYGLYILRGQLFGFGELDMTTFAPYAALALYWMLFEYADITSLRARAIGARPGTSLFLLNAAGLVGAAILQLPLDTPVPLTMFLAVSGAAYVGSAVLRARLVDRDEAASDPVMAAMSGSSQGATAIAALLVGWAIEWRFAGARRTATLLVEAELLFLSGLMLRDWMIRAAGSAVALLVSIHAIQGAGLSGPIAAWSWHAQGAVGAAALTAIVWFANRELLRARGIEPRVHEWTYSPLATYLVILCARVELPDGYSALAIWLFSAVLVEAGIRRGREYRYQAYVAGVSAGVVLLGWFVTRELFVEPPTLRAAWFILVPASLAAYVMAWRLAHDRTIAQPLERIAAAAMAQTFGTAFVVTLQWMVLDPAYVGAAWAATAAVLGSVGLAWKVSGLRWQAYPLLGLALVRVMRPILDPAAATGIEIGSALLVIGLLYAGSLAVRAAAAQMAKTSSDIEDAVRIAVSVVATISLGVVIFEELRPTLITVTWGLQGLTLFAIGLPARERLMRLSGLGVFVACIVRLFAFDLPQLEALARIMSFVALGAALLGVSWIYTRYRARIQKFL